MQTFLVLDPICQVLLCNLNKVATVVAVIAYFGNTLSCTLEGKSWLAVSHVSGYIISSPGGTFFCILYSNRFSVQLKQIEHLMQSANFSR